MVTKKEFLEFLQKFNDLNKDIFHAKTLEEFEKFADIQDELVENFTKKFDK